jgi:hypothetical protein
MDTFVCVLKTGGIYGPEHVQRLSDMIWRYYKPTPVICLTDHPEQHGIRLVKGWEGWWSKLELFDHDFGKTCYFDLDVTIRSVISWLDALPTDDGQVWGMKDALLPNLNSSVMVWQGPRPEVTKDYDGTPHSGGDQKWIYSKLKDSIQYLHPPLVTSFKAHGPKSGSVVVYHGKPKPWDVVHN